MNANSRFQQFVREHKGRLTPQRQFIVKELLSLKGHYDIQELHSRFLRKGKAINPSTIFRTLKLLAQAGIVVERKFTKGNTKYDVKVTHHDHLICLDCNKIVEFENSKLEDVQARIVRGYGFEMAYHKHEIYGYCSNCRRSHRLPNAVNKNRHIHLRKS